jgi:hypothetical protein
MYRIAAVQIIPNTMKLWIGNASRKINTPVKKVSVGAINWIKPNVERGRIFVPLANKYSGSVVTAPQSRSTSSVATGNSNR